MKNDNNYVLEAFDYNFIIIISQRRSNGRDKLKYAKKATKLLAIWEVCSSSSLCAQYKYKPGKKAVKKCYKGEELGEGVG